MKKIKLFTATMSSVLLCVVAMFTGVQGASAETRNSTVQSTVYGSALNINDSARIY